MDSKIILAILIVALIGIVAATYHGETGNLMNSLSNVATEDSSGQSVTDIAKATGDSANSVKVDESIVQPDSSVNSKVAPSKSSNNNQRTSQSNSGSSSNGGTSSNNGGSSSNQNTGQANTPTNTNNQNSNSNQSSGISEAEAMSIAKNSLPPEVTSDYQTVSEKTSNGEKYYEVKMYKNGEMIAYSDIDPNGKITGGAIKGEAPEV